MDIFRRVSHKVSHCHVPYLQGFFEITAIRLPQTIGQKNVSPFQLSSDDTLN
jgi:hypothetical protein